jgi:hypothetical protein
MIRDEELVETEQQQRRLAKWETLDRVTVLLTEEQKEGLDKLARRLMKFRAKETRGNPDKERITSNSIIRALIDIFLEHATDTPLEVISSEEDLKVWVYTVLG